MVAKQSDWADFLILEAMSSALKTVETLVKCSLDTNLPVWLSISCALDKKTDKLMLGYQESIEKNTKSFLYNDKILSLGFLLNSEKIIKNTLL